MGLAADLNFGFKGSVGTDAVPYMWPGARYASETADALKVTIGTGTRQCQIAGGTMWGDGVRSVWNSGASLASAAPAAGRRWDTVVIRRKWQSSSTPTGTATLALVQGGTQRAVSPAIDRSGAGTNIADQPIALIEVDSSLSALQSVVDLRVWVGAGGGLLAKDTAALGYLDIEGTVVTIGATQWVREDGLWRTLESGYSIADTVPENGFSYTNVSTGERVRVSESGGRIWVEGVCRWDPGFSQWWGRSIVWVPPGERGGIVGTCQASSGGFAPLRYNQSNSTLYMDGTASGTFSPGSFLTLQASYPRPAA